MRLTLALILISSVAFSQAPRPPVNISVASPIKNTSGTIGLDVSVDFNFTNSQTFTRTLSGGNNATTLLTLERDTSGTPANGLGSQIQFLAQDSSIIHVFQGAIWTAWSDVTHATSTSYMNFRLQNQASSGDKMRLFGDGSLSVGNTTDIGVPGVYSRFIPVTNAVSSSTSWTPDSNSYNQESQTSLSSDVTINAPSGTPSDGKHLILRIKSNGSGHNITWNGAYNPISLSLPSSIVASKTIYAGCIYNSNTSKWDVLAMSVEP